MTSKQEKLIRYYEQRLEKVRAMYLNATTHLQEDKNNDYIKFAEQELQAVKNGREW